MALDDLVIERPQGLYCPPGDFYIDPWRPVDRAVITHAHADHARAGHGHYLAHADAAGVLRARLGPITLQPLAYGQEVEHRGVRISLHPAGHVLGSAQVRLAHGGQVWVVSGDYFVAGDVPPGDDPNPTCPPFEPVRCDCFVTESTFGLPVYRWQPPSRVLADLVGWWRANAALGRPSLVLAYSFGKAQRLLAGLGSDLGPIAVHGAVAPINAAYRDAGVRLPPCDTVEALRARGDLARALVVAPPSVHGSRWAAALGDPVDAFASGWMQVRGARRRQGVDRGFVLSDHADWPGLLQAIAATGASRVIVTHGQEAVLVRWLTQQGLKASSFRTEFGDDAIEAQAAEAVPEAAPPAASAPA